MTTSILSRIGSFFKTVLFLSLAGLVGGGVALLYAPRSGKKTRAKLMSQGEALRKKMNKDVSHTRTQLRKQINQTNKIARKRVYALGNQLYDTVEEKQSLLRNRVKGLPISLFNVRHR
jgi:gas vesicle protein